MTDHQTILVIEDTPAIGRALRAALEARGYRVVVALTGESGIDAAAVTDPSAVILDLGLPDMDGSDVCRRIRSWSDVPIIVLTVDDTEHRKVETLDIGADDYVIKPFSTPELLARLRVALRRQRSGGQPVDPVLVVGDVVVDVPHHQVTVAGEGVDLTPKEFAFLALLARYPGRVLTHRTILQEVWGPEYGSETQYLRVYASQIRKKLGDDAAAPRLVTEPGVGYRLVDRSASG
ncbi:MAG TPA: response regulator transcription factor [Acidimicrobiales bacterium]|jgi:two-component system KDP operon response regulator KdpE|nr:response regulator transcription factor [Acidimicrobiales bacterium]